MERKFVNKNEIYDFLTYVKDNKIKIYDTILLEILEDDELNNEYKLKTFNLNTDNVESHNFCKYDLFVDIDIAFDKKFIK